MTERSIQDAETALALELLSFIEEAIGQILREEDEGDFLAWVRAEAPRRLPGLFADLPNEQAARAVAFELAREIWNKVPLPGAGYRPRSIPRPERNEPCPCGSGQKHKKCCGAVAGNRLELPFELEDSWALLLSRATEAEVAQLSADRRVPRAQLPDIALRLIDMDEAETALVLLEPLFEQPERLEERDAPAIEALIEAYDALRLDESKELAIAQLDTALRPPLHLALWEILAQSFTARGEDSRAWEAAERIRSADPDSPVLGSVEVILLLGENRLAEASERAKDALQRHRRHPGLSDEALAMLQETAEDPAASRRRMVLDDLLPSVERFERLLATVAGRPLRPYAVQTVGESPGTGRLILPEGLLEVEKDWVEVAGSAEPEGLEDGWDVEEDEDGEDDDDDDWEDEDEGDEDELSAAGQDLEEDGDLWDFDDDDEDDDWLNETEAIWSPVEAGTWLTFLEENPQAFDSLLVLSDLVLRASALADLRDDALRETLVRPLAARGIAILDAALATAPGALLPADLEENLPALEILEVSALLSGGPAPDRKPLERVLELDPEDNLAVRSQLGTSYLWAGEPEKTLDLAERFTDRDEPYLDFAKVIALRQLDRKEESLAALDDVIEYYPLIATAMAAASPRIPDGLLDLWQKDEELWQELGRRLEEEPAG